MCFKHVPGCILELQERPVRISVNAGVGAMLLTCRHPRRNIIVHVSPVCHVWGGTLAPLFALRSSSAHNLPSPPLCAQILLDGEAGEGQGAEAGAAGRLVNWLAGWRLGRLGQAPTNCLPDVHGARAQHGATADTPAVVAPSRLGMLARGTAAGALGSAATANPPAVSSGPTACNCNCIPAASSTPTHRSSSSTPLTPPPCTLALFRIL